MDCKNMLKRFTLLLIVISNITFADVNDSKVAGSQQSSQILPGNKQYRTEFDTNQNSCDLFMEELTFWDRKNTHKIKDIHNSTATTRKILRRPLQVIGIFEYKDTTGKAEYIDEFFKQYLTGKN